MASTSTIHPRLTQQSSSSSGSSSKLSHTTRQNLTATKQSFSLASGFARRQICPILLCRIFPQRWLMMTCINLCYVVGRQHQELAKGSWVQAGMISSCGPVRISPSMLIPPFNWLFATLYDLTFAKMTNMSYLILTPSRTLNDIFMEKIHGTDKFPLAQVVDLHSCFQGSLQCGSCGFPML